MQRYFSEEKTENNLIINSEDKHHILNVMRMKENDKIEVVYNKKLFICSLKIEEETILGKIIKEEKANEIKKEISIIIPLLKEAKMDFILGKTTELGVSKIIPYIAERSIIKLDDKKAKTKHLRWEKIVKEASEQSKRLDIPEITKIHTLKELINFEGLNIICCTKEKEKNIKSLLQNYTNCDKINIIVGPEGGFTTKEEEFLIKNGFKRTTLGNLIMRVETVPIFLMSVINYENME
jgi:RNA methyltransferase, RsmE family